MAKIHQRGNKEPYTMLQIRLKIRERNRLRVLCAELDVSMQEFVLRLLRNKFPGVISPQIQPRKYREILEIKEPEAELTKPPTQDDPCENS